jgi:hypothetical protein
MVKIKEILEFKKENFFDGAVQADWFYDTNMKLKSAGNYIFHGPKYYGISQSDVSASKHKLIDTASFVKVIYDKLYTDFDSSRFLLTIAGYGAGKSHLSVTLASLLSGDDIGLRDKISNKLVDVDEGIGKYIKELQDNNLVIVLNGMNDFNLNSEILKNAKRSLAMNGLDDSIFEDMTIAYQTAANFLNTTFNAFEDSYRKYAEKYHKYKRMESNELKKLLSSKVFEDFEAYQVINEVYKEKTGSYIKWEEGISASTILSKLYNKYVKEEKKFKGIVILFDEFGRYLEYAAAHPNLASESAIQQIFEAVQNGKPSMLFIGFIQSDLSAYLSRVSNQNITRYVSRYENSDKYYLSSNLETILASLLRKRNQNAEDMINNIFNGSLKLYSHRLYSSMARWIPENGTKGVWTNEDLFNKTIMRGCYPIHPTTISLLAFLSSWMQQRSTLSFLGEIFEANSDQVLGEDGIPFIYPTAVINSRIFNELLNAEEKGRQQGQQCTSFSELMNKHEEKLSEDEKEVLRAILILNLTKYKVYDRSDSITALSFNTGISVKQLEVILENLENELGIIFFDEAIKRYGFTAETSSKVDFNREFTVKRTKVNRSGLLNTIKDDIKKEIGLDKLEEIPFGRVSGIATGEWNFTKRLIEMDEFDDRYAINLVNEFRNAIHPDTPKGNVVFLYSNKRNYEEVKNIENIIRSHKLEAVPVIIYLIYDGEDIILESLIDLRCLASFSILERSRFRKYISSKYDESVKKIIRRFTELARNRQIITSRGIEISEYRLKDICLNKLNDIYKTPFLFTFDGFEKKVTPVVRKRYNSVAASIINRTVCSKSDFESLDAEIRNRINSVLSVNSSTSWKVLLDNYVLTEPISPVPKKIYNEILERVKAVDFICAEELFEKYLSPPYGMNIYSAVLFFIYFISHNTKNIEIYSGINKIKVNSLISYFNDDKKEIVQNVLKLKVSYREKASDNVIKDFIDEVNSNSKIEKCEELLENANRIRLNEDIPENLEGLFINLETQLKIGIDSCNKIYRDLEEAQKEYEESFKKFFKPFSYVKINSYLGGIKEGKIPRTNFYYSSEYIEKVRSIREGSLEKIVFGLENYLDRIKIDIDNIDNIKRYTLQLVKILKNHGSIEFAEAIENKIVSLENKLKERIKYETILDQCNQELDQCDSYIRRYNNFEQAERLIKYWDEYFNGKNVPDGIRNEYMDKIRKQRILLDQKYQQITGQTKELISKASILTNSGELRGYKRELEEAINKGIHKDYKDEVTALLSMVEDTLKDVQDLQKDELVICELDKAASALQKKYINSPIISVVNKALADKYEQEKSKEDTWKQKYLKNIRELNSMSVAQLLQWKSQTEFKPYYLTDETVEDCSMTLDIVNEKLSQHKIENILDLFKQLDDEQRSKCLLKLKNII